MQLATKVLWKQREGRLPTFFKIRIRCKTGAFKITVAYIRQEFIFLAHENVQKWAVRGWYNGSWASGSQTSVSAPLPSACCFLIIQFSRTSGASAKNPHSRRKDKPLPPQAAFFSFFKKIYFIDHAIIVVSFFTLYFPLPCTLPPTHILPLQFMSMDHTYKFFGFYISYTILNRPPPPSIFYLPFMLLILSTFPTPSPFPNPSLITLHVISISVILFLFQLLAQFVSGFGFFRFSC